MIGAIIGDIVGSVYEFDNWKSKEFELFQKESTFTDDTVMTVAIAEFLCDDHGNPGQSRVVSAMHKWYKKYPNLTYGAGFNKWIQQFDKNADYVNFKPYNSFGNGAAMKISPIGEYGADVLSNAKWVTEVTHNHKEGIKGAQAVASAIDFAIKNKDRDLLRKHIIKEFKYDLDDTVDNLRETYEYNETCQGTIPQAIICFLESTDFEDAIRNAISIGGDSDTLACITGSIAEAYYQEIPLEILKQVVKRLPTDIKNVIKEFYWEVYNTYPKITDNLFKML